MKEKKRPVIPVTKLSRDERPPGVKGDKWNWKIVDGDWVADLLDEGEVPAATPIIPEKKKGKK